MYTNSCGISSCPEAQGDDRRHQRKRMLQTEMGLSSRRVAKDFDNTTQLQSNPIPVVIDGSIELGKLLGRGGFNEVHEIMLKRADKDEEEVLAVKQLRPSIMAIRCDFHAGALDLVLEAKILNALSHKNIIRLHGVPCEDDSLKSSYLDGNQYCLYLDRLYGTVDEQFDEWRRRYAPAQKKEELRQRLENIALPIAAALEHLHSRHIIFRDIKPSNMGYDAEGTVKLFDFGLARELNPQSNRRMTGATGSRRYMAPEVALSQPYGLPADVYSYGVFLFECCTLIKPFDGMTRSEHINEVAYGRYRPSFHSFCATSKSLQKFIRRCWDKSPKIRPNCIRIVEHLQRELQTLEQEQENENKPQGPLFNFFRSRWSPSRSHDSMENACAA
jgi:serine/threonine protein kinase